MWPITLSILNLPRQIRNLPRSIVLAEIIPGTTEPQNMDPYMEILVDGLCSVNGLELYDSYRNEKFQLKMDLLRIYWTILARTNYFLVRVTDNYINNCITRGYYVWVFILPYIKIHLVMGDFCSQGFDILAPS